jgi:hypothetical protein
VIVPGLLLLFSVWFIVLWIWEDEALLQSWDSTTILSVVALNKSHKLKVWKGAQRVRFKEKGRGRAWLGPMGRVTSSEIQMT